MQKSMVKLVSVADVITLLNACFGFLAILMLFLDEVRFAFSFILLALLADGLDGIVARKLGVGKIGDYLEAMADMTSMAIAPMMFVFKTYHESIASDAFFYVLLAILILFLICSITRLASFHIMKKDNFFTGLPASASTIFLIIAAFLEVKLLYILPFIVLLSFAMISRIRFPKLGTKIDVIATILIFLTIILGSSYYNIAPILLFTALAIYAVVGPLYVNRYVSR